MDPGFLPGLVRRVQMAVGFGRVTAPPADDGVVQRLQARFSPDELRDDLVTVQHYGLASVPPVGSDVVALFLSGDRSNGVVVGHNHQEGRVRGQAPGEACLYNGHGVRLYLRRGEVLLDCGDKPCTVRGATTVDVEASGAATLDAGGPATVRAPSVALDAPLVEVTGDLRVAGEITAKNGSLAFSTHAHTLVRGGTDNSGPPKTGT